jgi:hypothetical protein
MTTFYVTFDINPRTPEFLDGFLAWTQVEASAPDEAARSFFHGQTIDEDEETVYLIVTDGLDVEGNQAWWFTPVDITVSANPIQQTREDLLPPTPVGFANRRTRPG